MQEEKELSLYSLIEDFAQQFTYRHEDGLDIDISVFLRTRRENQTIKYFTVRFDRNTRHYKITIIHSEEVHSSNVHSIFLQFQGYVALASGGTMYAHKEIKNGIRYVLLLLQPTWKEKVSYYCEIDFVGPQLL